MLAGAPGTGGGSDSDVNSWTVLASIGSSLAILFILVIAGFFGFLYLGGRAFGAGLKAGGNRWQAGKNEANAQHGRVPPPPPDGPTTPPPPSPNPGWYRDPWGTGRRYWNGASWTRDTAV